MTIGPYSKAIYAFVSVLLSSLVAAAIEDGINQFELLSALSVAVVATGGVFGLTNTRLRSLDTPRR